MAMEIMEMEPEQEQAIDVASACNRSGDEHDSENSEQSQGNQGKHNKDKGKRSRKRKAQQIEVSIAEDKDTDTVVCIQTNVGESATAEHAAGLTGGEEETMENSMHVTRTRTRTCRKKLKHKENTNRDATNTLACMHNTCSETGDNTEEKEEKVAEEEKEKETKTATTKTAAPAVSVTATAVQPAVPLPPPQQFMMMRQHHHHQQQQQFHHQQLHVAMRQTQAQMMQRARASMFTNVQLQQAQRAQIMIPLGATSVPIQQHLQILASQKQAAAAMAKQQHGHIFQLQQTNIKHQTELKKVQEELAGVRSEHLDHTKAMAKQQCDHILQLQQTNEKHQAELKKVQEELAEFRSEHLDHTKAKAKETKALQAEIERGKMRVLKLEQRLQQEKEKHASAKRQLKNKNDCKSTRMFNSNTQLMLPNSDSATTGNKHDLKWQAQYDQLKLFKQQYGHTTVTKDNPEHQRQFPSLSNWVRTQRSSWASLREGKKTYLTPHRIHLMKQIGFDWHPLGRDTVSFDQRLHQLISYKTARGDCNVPQKYKEDPGLGEWVLHIRRMYRNGKLNENRIATLEEVGFQWRMRAVRGSKG